MIEWYVVLIIVLVFMVCGIAVFFWVRAELKKRDATKAELEKEIDELKLRLSQNQIRPHFIFNSILAIKQLCIEEPRQAAKALQHFATYLRANLDAMSSDELVPFERELECIKEYVALEQADPAVNFTITYKTEFSDFKLPLMVVEPMVENAIRHGISRRADGVIVVGSKLEGAKIVVSVEDNGVGFGNETRQQAEHRSIGIKNTRERLKILCNGELNIINTGHGTIIRIELPFTGNK